MPNYIVITKTLYCLFLLLPSTSLRGAESGDALPKVDDIVAQIIENQEREAEREFEKLKQLHSTEDPIWFEEPSEMTSEQVEADQPKAKERMKDYLKWEKRIRARPINIPACRWAGDLHYGMSPTEMKNAIILKFRSLYKSGFLITEPFKEKPEFYFQKSFKQTDLTRVWGSVYLNSVLPKGAKAADHYVILPDETKEIEIEVHYDYNTFEPILRTIRNGYILAKEITGDDAIKCCWTRGTFHAHGYVDFAGKNIIRDENGICVAVDTEYKSFQTERKYRSLNKYLRSRFTLLHGNQLSQTYKISLSEIQESL